MSLPKAGTDKSVRIANRKPVKAWLFPGGPWKRLRRWPPRQERQVITQHKYRHGGEHQEQADPETPIVMRTLPVGSVGMSSTVTFRPFVSVLTVIIFAR